MNWERNQGYIICRRRTELMIFRAMVLTMDIKNNYELRITNYELRITNDELRK